VRRDFEIQRSRSLTDTAGSIIVRTVARAEEAHVDTFIGRRDATKMGANTNNDGVFVLDREAFLISLGVLQSGDGGFVKLFALHIRALVQEDGLTTPDDGLAFLRIHRSDFDFDVRFEDKGHLGLTHPPDGGDGVTETEGGEADESRVEDVVKNASLVFGVNSGGRLEDVLAEEFFVEHGTSPVAHVVTVLAFDTRVGGTFRVGVEDDFLRGINLGEGRVGEFTITTELVGHFLRTRGSTEFIHERLDDAIILGDVFIEFVLLQDELRRISDTSTTEEVEGRRVATEHFCFVLFFFLFLVFL
jgi:hypothetical protein